MAAVNGVLLTGGGDIQPSRYGAQPLVRDPRRRPGPRRLRDPPAARWRSPTTCPCWPPAGACRCSTWPWAGRSSSTCPPSPARTTTSTDVAGAGAQGQDRARQPPGRGPRAPPRWRSTPSTTRPSTRPPPGTRAVAWADDGTVEAIEVPGSPHIVAVQWHPELLEDRPEQQGLFRQLVAPRRASGECRARAGDDPAGDDLLLST